MSFLSPPATFPEDWGGLGPRGVGAEGQCPLPPGRPLHGPAWPRHPGAPLREGLLREGTPPSSAGGCGRPPSALQAWGLRPAATSLLPLSIPGKCFSWNLCLMKTGRERLSEQELSCGLGAWEGTGRGLPGPASATRTCRQEGGGGPGRPCVSQALGAQDSGPAAPSRRPMAAGLGGGGGRTRGGTGGPGGTVASPQWQRAAPASRCLNFLSGCSSEHFNVSENQRAAADLSLEGLPPPRLLRLSPRGDGRVWQPARATTAGGGCWEAHPCVQGHDGGGGVLVSVWGAAARGALAAGLTGFRMGVLGHPRGSRAG